jgi:RNA polymerase sigma-70 factor, ECF subfamily
MPAKRMDETTLMTLMEASAQNDEKAFRQLVEGCQSKAYTLAFRMLCNEEDARDMVQETFLRIWLNRTSYLPEKKFTTWMYAIATNLCLDKIKSSKRFVRSPFLDETLKQVASAEDVEQAVIDSELGALIRTLTLELTPKQKAVFTLRDLEGLEVEEIAQITGLSPGNIKSNLFLARQNLRKRMSRL